MVHPLFRVLGSIAGALSISGCVVGRQPAEANHTDSRDLLGLPLPLPLPLPSPGPGATAPAATGTCGSLNDYTAAIAEAAIACTGTMCPSTFVVGSTGRLQRNFSDCLPSVSPATAAQLRQTIDDFLSLQVRANVNAASCFPNQWTTWRTSFLAAGNTACPTWTLISSLGSATVATVDQLVGQLPVLNGPNGGLLQNVLD